MTTASESKPMILKGPFPENPLNSSGVRPVFQEFSVGFAELDSRSELLFWGSS